MMKRAYAFAAVTLGALLVAESAVAQGFEGSGVVSEVDTARFLVKIDDDYFTLPRSTLFESRPAIEQVRPGQRVNLSGPDGNPYPVIESIYIHPDTVHGWGGVSR